VALNAKYTDEDVRRSEQLYLTAIEFLKLYQGDWDFLVKAKNHLTRHGELPVPAARAVLNAMRSNPEGSMMLPATPTGRLEGDNPHAVDLDYYHRRQLANGHMTRPAHIDLPSKWHVQYALSTWPTAQVFHVLRPELSHIRWYPHTGKFGYDICLWCQYPLGWSWNSRYILTNDQQGRRICKGCDRKMQENT